MTTNKKDIKYKIPKNFYKSFQKELSQDAKLIKELLTTDKLNKTENFNISKGNVKEDNINVAQRISQDDELMKKIFPHKEVINGKIVSVFPYIEEVYPLKDVPQEVVSKMETTTLTEQWKKGELKTGWYYVSRNNNVEMLEYVGDYFLSGDVPLIDDKDVSTLEVLAPVPSWEEYLESESHCAVYSEVNQVLKKKNQQLKELLKECKNLINECIRGDYVKELCERINEVLK